MQDFLPNLLLVLCGIGAVIALIIAYMWYFVFGRSLRGILMAGLSIMLNRDSTIDLNADVVLKKRPEQAKKEMTQEVEALDFQGSLSSHDKYIPQIESDDELDFSAQTVDAQSKPQGFVSSSFTSIGRFRRVQEVFSRPFLRMRITSQSDDVPSQNVKLKADPSDNENE